MQRVVVLSRNLNQGQRGMPTTAQLRDALTRAGAESVVTYQSNGTVVFDAVDPQRVVDRARPLIEEGCAWSDVGIVLDLERVRAAIEALPSSFTECPEGMELYQDVLAFVSPADGIRMDLPWWSRHEDLLIHDVDESLGLVHATSFRRPDRISGNLTAELERGWPIVATTRTRGTMERLLRKVDAIAGG